MKLSLAIYGKGGSGKSTLAAALSACFAGRGLKVLHVGCDPKADSSRALVDAPRITTVMGTALETDRFDASSLLMGGRLGITCVEAGGPEPGVGCAGRGISRTFELLEELGVSPEGYDVVLYDVLGDVVCGGFATPMKAGFARLVLVVASGSGMSLFAANNILKAIRRFHRNGTRLAGLVGNYLGGQGFSERLHSFAEAASTRVLAELDFDPAIPRAEELRRTIVELEPDGRTAGQIRSLAEELLGLDEPPRPVPLDEAAFERLVRGAGRAGEGG